MLVLTPHLFLLHTLPCFGQSHAGHTTRGLGLMHSKVLILLMGRLRLEQNAADPNYRAGSPFPPGRQALVHHLLAQPFLCAPQAAWRRHASDCPLGAVVAGDLAGH